MQPALYRVSPSLIDFFQVYLNDWGADLAFNVDDMLKMINHGWRFKDDKARDIDNSVALFKKCIFGLEVESDQIKKAKRILPKVGNTDVVSRCLYRDIEIVGTIDFMGFGKAVCIEGLAKYHMPSMLHSGKQWLMKGLESQGLKSMNYIIQAEGEVYLETYTPKTYDFGRMMDLVDGLREFLIEYDHLITNQNVKLDYRRAA